MQQTETYKLNLVEGEDTFSPLPLNENAEKLEGALGGLDARVTTLEVHKIAVGRYAGTGPNSPQVFELGFTPKAVIVCYANCYSAGTTMAVLGFPTYTNHADNLVVSIIPGGFQIGNNVDSRNSHYNATGHYFNYVALA